MIDLFEMDDKNKEKDTQLPENEEVIAENNDDVEAFEETFENQEVAEEHPVEQAEETSEDAKANEVVCLEDDDFLTQKIDEIAEEENKKEPNCNFSYNQDDEKKSDAFSFTYEREKEEDTYRPQYQSTFENLNLNELDRIQRPDVELDFDNYGLTFRRLREAVGVEFSTINQNTHIPVDYLKALEAEDYDNLPKEVFIVAYIRKLGNIYHLTEEEINRLAQKVKSKMDVEMEIPDESSEKIIRDIDMEGTAENLAKLKKIFIYIGIGVVAIVLLITAIMMLLAGAQKSDVKKDFRSEEILEIQKEPQLEKYILPMKK